MNTWRLLFLVDSCLEFLIGLGASFLLLVTNYHKLTGLKQCTCHLSLWGHAVLGFLWVRIMGSHLEARLGKELLPSSCSHQNSVLCRWSGWGPLFPGGCNWDCSHFLPQALSMGSSHGTAGSHSQHRTESPPKTSITVLHNVTTHIPSPICLKHVTGGRGHKCMIPLFYSKLKIAISTQIIFVSFSFNYWDRCINVPNYDFIIIYIYFSSVNFLFLCFRLCY